MTVPLVPADQAFSALVSVECAQGTMKSSGAPCFSAAVTAARLGEVQVQTGRGLAAVPAWLFTVSELPRPVARVAVAPEAIGSSPAPTLPPANSRLDSVMASPFRLDEVEGNTVRFWFIPEYAPTVGPVAYETADVVVLGVQAERPYGWGGIPEREPELITVMLSKPVGSRLLLGIDGKPIPQSGRMPTTPAIRPT